MAAMGRKKKQRAEEEKESDSQSPEPVREIHPEILDFCYHFNIDESLALALDEAMEDRRHCFDIDMKHLWELAEQCPQPVLMLRGKIKEIESGRFVAKAKTHDEVVDFCKKHRLDKGATTKLIESMAIRERDHKTNIKMDLQVLGIHLQNSNAPSKLVSMRLKDIRSGYALGHCVYMKEELTQPADQGGPSVDGKRPKKLDRSGYSDQELQKRFGAESSRGGAMMTEEQARNFQKSMRKEAERKKSRSRSRSRGRKRSRSRRRSRSRSRSRGRRRGGRSSSRRKSPSRKRKSPTPQRKKKSHSPQNKADRSHGRKEDKSRSRRDRSPSRDRRR